MTEVDSMFANKTVANTELTRDDSPQQPAIEAINLVRQFDKKLAVNNVSFRVDQGEFFGFLGPNGAGKSTTIKMLVGLLRPTEGSAKICGIDMWQQPKRAKQLIGVLPEGMNLYDRLTGREFVRFAGAMYGLSKPQAEERCEELLELLDLSKDGDKMVIDYSQGMRKKTALASAIIHAPRVLFLDEPFEGVDAISGSAIRDILQQLRNSGTTIFFSSHILEVVERLCTKLAVISQGQIVAQGTVEELRQLARVQDDSSLEEIFLRTVGATDSDDEEPKARGLSWLHQ